VQKACGCLIEIDQPKAYIEGAYALFMLHKDKHKANYAKGNVKDVIRRRNAGQAFFVGDQKTEHTDEYQYRSKDG
jgi:hypothetical protein